MKHLLKNIFSLRFTLLLSVLILGASVYVFFFSLRQELTGTISLSSEIVRKNETIVDLASRLTAKRIESLLYIGLKYANRDEIVTLVQEGDWDEAAFLARTAIKESEDMIERVFFTDTHGNLMADFPEISEVHGLNFSHREWYEGYIKEQEPYLSGPYVRLAEPKLNVVGLALPIGKNKLGVALGILVLQVRLEEFQEITKSIAASPRHALFIVDSMGKVICHTSEGPGEEILDYSDTLDVKNVMAGRNGSQIMFMDNKYYLSSYKSVPPFGWGVVFRVPLGDPSSE